MMDELKDKFFDLLNSHRNDKIPIVSDPDLEFNSNLGLLVNSQRNETIVSTMNETMCSDLDIMDNIEKVYFNDDFNASRYELEKLGGSLDMELIENNLHKLQAQLAVVSKRVLHMILENQASCQKEFIKMQEIKQGLNETLETCQTARYNLHKSQNIFTTASLGILSSYRKRKVVQDLLRSFNMLKTLLQAEGKLQLLLRNEQFSEAVTVLLECQRMAQTYRHFHCVAALSGKLQDTLVIAEEQLDVALAKICYKFNSDIYAKLQGAYGQLGKRRIAMDQLHMHYTSTIHSSAFTVVHEHVTQENSLNSKKPYINLCKQVENKQLIPCLFQLCQTLWNILRSYNQVVQWHTDNKFRNFGMYIYQLVLRPIKNVNMKGGIYSDFKYIELRTKEKIDYVGLNLESLYLHMKRRMLKFHDNDFEQNINEQYIKQKLDSGLNKLWHDVQNRVSILITNSNLTSFKFDDFLQILAILHKLMQIGEEFCGNDSKEIQASIKGQSSHYFRKYHLSRLEELRLFLENEAWNPCPVKSTFNLLHLQEFKNLRNLVQNAAVKASHHKSDSFDCVSSESGGYFSRFSESGSPFDVYNELDSAYGEEDILLEEDGNSAYAIDESDDEDKVDRHNGMNGIQSNQQRKNCILLTNTTLTVLRHCGRYLQMSRFLRSITSDVLFCLKQLFEYYLYAVSIFFTVDLPVVMSNNSSYSTQKLISFLKRIEDNLIKSEDCTENNESKIAAPVMSPTVNLKDPEKLFGLAERVVGVESLIFLSEQFNLLHDYLLHLIDEENDRHLLELFYSQEVSMAVEVRIPVYECVVRQIIDTKHILNLMTNVNWEVKDVMCLNSSYVDILFRGLEVFLMRLEIINSTMFTIPAEVLNCLWHLIAELLADIFVEGARDWVAGMGDCVKTVHVSLLSRMGMVCSSLGDADFYAEYLSDVEECLNDVAWFSNVKKCSDGGRALMQLDFTQSMTKFEVMSSIKPFPKREFVEAYVKAYYLPESSLQSWIQTHTEYTSKQLQALVNCTLYNNKKARQKLITLLKEMDRKNDV